MSGIDLRLQLPLGLPAAILFVYLSVYTSAGKHSTAPHGSAKSSPTDRRRVWCHQTLRRFFTWEEVAVRDDHQLITSRPHSLARHPSYTGWVLMMAGNFTLLAAKGLYFTEAGLWRTTARTAVGCAVTVYLSWVTFNLVKRTASEDDV